ncbi:hypothetical protein DIPPA_24431 [Diplonema papillatum]|nr:hypothetical protein DIPPA_24431 [Diplonema papillatum]
MTLATLLAEQDGELVKAQRSYAEYDDRRNVKLWEGWWGMWHYKDEGYRNVWLNQRGGTVSAKWTGHAGVRYELSGDLSDSRLLLEGARCVNGATKKLSSPVTMCITADGEAISLNWDWFLLRTPAARTLVRAHPEVFVLRCSEAFFEELSQNGAADPGSATSDGPAAALAPTTRTPPTAAPAPCSDSVAAVTPGGASAPCIDGVTPVTSVGASAPRVDSVTPVTPGRAPASCIDSVTPVPPVVAHSPCINSMTSVTPVGASASCIDGMTPVPPVGAPAPCVDSVTPAPAAEVAAPCVDSRASAACCGADHAADRCDGHGGGAPLEAGIAHSVERCASGLEAEGFVTAAAADAQVAAMQALLRRGEPPPAPEAIRKMFSFASFDAATGRVVVDGERCFASCEAAITHLVSAARLSLWWAPAQDDLSEVLDGIDCFHAVIRVKGQDDAGEGPEDPRQARRRVLKAVCDPRCEDLMRTMKDLNPLCTWEAVVPHSL